MVLIGPDQRSGNLFITLLPKNLIVYYIVFYSPDGKYVAAGSAGNKKNQF
jgi:hypothetical protein